MATLTITERSSSSRPTAITLVRVQEFLSTPFPGFAVQPVPGTARSFRINVDREQAIFLSNSDSYTTQINSIKLAFQVRSN